MTDIEEIIAELRDLEQRGTWMGSMPAEDVGRIAKQAADLIARLSADKARMDELREDVKRLTIERDNASKLFVETAQERNDLYTELHGTEEALETTRGWCSHWMSKAAELGDATAITFVRERDQARALQNASTTP